MSFFLILAEKTLINVLWVYQAYPKRIQLNQVKKFWSIFNYPNVLKTQLYVILEISILRNWYQHHKSIYGQLEILTSVHVISLRYRGSNSQQNQGASLLMKNEYLLVSPRVCMCFRAFFVLLFSPSKHLYSNSSRCVRLTGHCCHNQNYWQIVGVLRIKQVAF